MEAALVVVVLVEGEKQEEESNFIQEPRRHQLLAFFWSHRQLLKPRLRPWFTPSPKQRLLIRNSLKQLLIF
jgi:hypothetical protein